ncbi:glucans biosynthesis glucosyltransferase MdoH [Oecophyllibacter saccharovorans]|uniref:Glucans biosynthesis glucosyltransferase H n=1 Tax=Oecophyllibacter saccharovorans TaxID=2558360 RepID=A0A506UL25_9PROT|nr:glucans biosynthesis glucosyltransferase MdoH [Oecophyllibacter saccharovorans]TPW34051.1 glucans biosynthesis glucosyltransferase MdoH [Oecophyllibacter saccharovorans]
MTDPTAHPAPASPSPGARAYLPPDAPLAMPVQNLDTAPDLHGRHPRRLPTRPAWLWARRLFVFGGALALTLFSVDKLNRVFNSFGMSTLGVIILILFAILSFWISLSFTSALAGFVSLIRRGGLGLGIHRHGPLPVLEKRTAILLPTYNEPPDKIMANLRAMLRSLEATGQLGAFDVFILSDTTNPDLWVQEEKAYLDLCREPWAQNVYYRHRLKNTDRKAGNIGEWVRQFGNAYETMLTLDADSLMDGGLIVRLVGAMEKHPQVGLIQSLPVIVEGRTLFARLQQFAGRIYGPMIAHGIAWWHGSEGNYWGHNAVIRTRAFAEQAGLPHLSGKPPFGGHILSHDFVEAALMRRGGWAIHMVPGLFGSYEESPPSLTDIAIRDRRWCQGNLQHGRLLATKGLHWISRSHMLVGIGSYVMSPLWLLFLLCGILISLQAGLSHPEYFGTKRMLFPHWPHVDPIQARDLFIGTMVILLAPKALAYIAACFDRHTREGSGGAGRLALSVLIETLIGGLIAPIAMMIQTSGILSILMGRDSGWKAQNRDDGRVSIKEVMHRYWIYSALGVALSVAAWSVSLPLFLWMLPVLIGLVLAIPLVAFTGSTVMGQDLRKAGLLLIPEETHPPRIIKMAEEEEGHVDHDPALEASLALRENATLRRAHEDALPPPREPGDPIDVALLVGLLKVRESTSLKVALERLTPKEKSAVLANAEGVELLAALPLE